jgi:hypothetical protein
VSRLTFNIKDAAALVGAKRESPFRALREKLFGIGTLPVRPASVNYGQMIARRVTEKRSAPMPSPIPHSFAKPAKAVARSAPVFAETPVSLRAPFQMEYKDRLIVAHQSNDGSWSATHLPLDADPARDFTAQEQHRFMARIMAIASVQIEIDELAERA